MWFLESHVGAPDLLGVRFELFLFQEKTWKRQRIEDLLSNFSVFGAFLALANAFCLAKADSCVLFQKRLCHTFLITILPQKT